MHDAVAFTGHRPTKLGGYGDSVFGRLVTLAEDYLRENDAAYAISGMALGWDQAAAVAALNLGIPLLAAIPFVGQESRWPLSSQILYRERLARATWIQVVCPGTHSAAAFQQRNEWMVDNGSKLAALWDGSLGGTRNCVKYAADNDRPYDNLWPRWSAGVA